MKKILLIFFIIFLTGCTQATFVTLELPEGQNIRVKKVITFAEVQKGLSGIEKMNGYDGMWFTMQSSGNVSFWMKDMRFDLDIIYLNDQKQILEIYKNQKACQENQECIPITAKSDDVKYVLELPAGKSDEYNLNINDYIK